MEHNIPQTEFDIREADKAMHNHGLLAVRVQSEIMETVATTKETIARTRALIAQADALLARIKLVLMA